MKKYLGLFLILVLVLTGCANDYAEETETTAAIETNPVGYYIENSAIENQTAGAVRHYSLPEGEYRWIKSIGDRILLATNANPARLTVLSGDTCVPTSSMDIESMGDMCEAFFNGFAYLDESNHAVIYLDPQLKQIQSISLPEDATGPVIAKDGNQVFYCVGNEIRAMDISRKISRLVRTLNAKKSTLLENCFDGKVLVVKIEDNAGYTDTLYISADNGQTLTVENDLQFLSTYEDDFFAERLDGIVHQRIVGTRSGKAEQLIVPDSNVVSAFELGGLLGYNVDENGLVLNFYDLTLKKRTASVTVAGILQPQAFLPDRWSNCIWILAPDPDGIGMILLKWNVSESEIQDETACVTTLFTAESPDVAAIEGFGDRINALNKKYGVRIRIWKDAVKSAGGHVLEPEHQVSAISDMLDQLQAVLSEFPSNFISKSISSKVRICLVRNVDGKPQGTQYWDGSNAYIALSTGTDIRTEFLKAFGSVIDSHVLGNSPKYDYWDTLNPSGFAYGGIADVSLTTGENPAFVNMESMVSGTADRANVFCQAMLTENSDLFKGEIMQKKLIMLCKAIRDAWNLDKSKDIYPWEQYLDKPIASKKK